MKNIGILLILNLWTLVFPLSAQRFAENYWHSGKVYVTGGDTIVGKLKFDLQNEIVQIEGNGGLKTLTARKVLAFEFYDRAEQKDRYFYALPFTKVANYQTPTFFELLKQDSPLSLLCRETLVTQTVIANNPWAVANPGIPVTQTYVKNNFYFLNKAGKIKPFGGSKKDLLLLMEDKEKEMKEFLKDNRIRLDNKGDMAEIVVYYNSLKK